MPGHSSNPMRKVDLEKNFRLSIGKRNEQNDSILSELDVREELLGKIINLKVSYLDHIMRGSGSSLTHYH